MDDSHAMSLEQIRALVAANSVMRFAGQRRQEVYEWVERTLVRHQYAGLRKPDKGVLRLYLAQMTGLKRAQVTRLITGYQQTGRVIAAPYLRARFPSIYTAADVELLSYVDRAHGNLSGPATRRILSTASMARQHTSGWRGSRWHTCIGYAPPRHTGNATPRTSRRGPRRSPSANGASRSRRASQDICASIPCIRAIGMATKGCITSMPSTKSRNGRSWQPHRTSPNSGCFRYWRTCSSNSRS